MTVKDMQTSISDWANKVFPDRTAASTLSKLVLKEIPELLTGDLSEPEEYADVVILVMDLATLMGVDIEEAVKNKMEINRNRKWGVDEYGLYQHID